MYRCFGCLLAALLSAQETTIRTTVPLVIAPATVTDRQGRPVDGLVESDFLLLDNQTPQKIHVDESFIPISLVVAVQANGLARPAVAKLRKAGSLFLPLVAGERGEAAVAAFADEVKLLQDFTPDPAVLGKALGAIRAGGERSRMNDAVVQAVQRLAERPANRRRVLLLIGETRDRGSETKIEEAITRAQRENVVIYPLTYSAFLTAFTARPADAAPAGGLNLLAVFTEIHRLGTTNAADVYARYTGGRHLSFQKQRGLEQTILRIGQELHRQYLVSFSPAQDEQADFHEIRIAVKGRPDLVVRTRPGYWTR